MRTTYVDPDSGGQIDLICGLILSDRYWTISRIIVPEPHRRQGAGNRLLKRVLADADNEKIVLVLEINPYGAMSYNQLEDWYKRNGFEWTRSPRWEGVMFRWPKPKYHIHMWTETWRDEHTKQERTGCRCGAELT